MKVSTAVYWRCIMAQEKEEEKEKLSMKISRLNLKIVNLTREKATIDEEIYKLAKKRDKVILKLRKNYL
tara:strand:+ start:635 stop:841 length:207 start_codon:yes stop_codon:yes gene_type:complete